MDVVARTKRSTKESPLSPRTEDNTRLKCDPGISWGKAASVAATRECAMIARGATTTSTGCTPLESSVSDPGVVRLWVTFTTGPLESPSWESFLRQTARTRFIRVPLESFPDSSSMGPITSHASTSCTPTLSANADELGPSHVSTLTPLTSTRTASASAPSGVSVSVSVSERSVTDKRSAMNVNAGRPDLARSDAANTYVDVDATVFTARPTALVTADWPRRYIADAAHRKPIRFFRISVSFSPASSSSSTPNSLSSSLSSASWNSPSSSSSCMSSSARLRAVNSSSRLSSFSSEYSSAPARSASSGGSQS